MGYAAFDRGDFEGVLELFLPDVIWRQPEGVPEAGTFHGTAEVRGWFRQWGEIFDEVRIEASDYVRVNDATLLARVQLRGVGRGSGAPVELRFAQAWTFRGDRVALVREYVSYSAAKRVLLGV